jgi:Amidohydrolase family
MALSQAGNAASAGSKWPARAGAATRKGSAENQAFCDRAATQPGASGRDRECHDDRISGAVAAVAKLGEVREAGLRSLEILQMAGVKIGFGTDLLGAMHRHQAHEFVIRAEAMTPFAFAIIRSATTVNAELLNRSGEIGVVAPAARADLIAINGNPLADISLLAGQGAHLTHIIKDGIFYKRALARTDRGANHPRRLGAACESRPYLIFASLKTTCLRATGSNFFNSSLAVLVRGFFFVT